MLRHVCERVHVFSTVFVKLEPNLDWVETSHSIPWGKHGKPAMYAKRCKPIACSGKILQHQCHCRNFFQPRLMDTS